MSRLLASPGSPRRAAVFRTVLAAVAAARLGIAPAGAEAPSVVAPPPGSAESLQRQIDELREGQRRLLEEVASLRRQLAEAPARADVAAQPQPAPFHTLNVRGEPFRGGARARVAIVEFSDFNCSHCAQFETNVYPRLDETYLRTGRVKYLFRDLPDRLDADALAKAEAARCAGEQGKFWEMHDRLFADPLPFGGENAARHVAALGIDAGKFDACLQSHRYREPIRRSAAMAARMEIHGTPAFLVGTVDESGDVVQSTRIFMGAESFESFRGELDALLEAASKPKK